MSKKARKEIVEIRKEREHKTEVLGRAVTLLKKLPEGKQKDQLRSLLRTYLINNGCSLLVTPEYQISPEHKQLIRDDCNGCISGINSGLLSKDYVEAFDDTKKRRMRRIETYGTALRSSVFEREMAQYPSYRHVRKYLLINLINEGVRPEIIQKMNIADFRSFIHDHCYDEFMAYREREGFVKAFIRTNEQEFYSLLCNSGEHPIYVENLIQRMNETGSAASFEMEYKGQIITGVGFDIDHKDPLYCPNDITSYPEVNARRSLNLVEIGAHRLKHAVERMVISPDGAKTYEKIMMPQYCAALLDFEHKILYDFDNPQHVVIAQRPNIDNLILINKVEALVNSITLSNENKRGKSSRNYINKNGRNDGPRR